MQPNTYRNSARKSQNYVFGVMILRKPGSFLPKGQEKISPGGLEAQLNIVQIHLFQLLCFLFCAIPWVEKVFRGFTRVSMRRDWPYYCQQNVVRVCWFLESCLKVQCRKDNEHGSVKHERYSLSLGMGPYQW
jgi:hypothetical protein